MDALENTHGYGSLRGGALDLSQSHRISDKVFKAGRMYICVRADVLTVKIDLD